METGSLTGRWRHRLFRILESDDSGKPVPRFVNGVDRSHDCHVREHNPVAGAGNVFLCLYRKEYKLAV
jgi:hypothetical protein